MTWAVLRNNEQLWGAMSRQYYACSEQAVNVDNLPIVRVIARGLSLEEATELRHFLEELDK